MKKVLMIEDRSRRKFLLRTFLKIFNYETYIISADEMNQMIADESPDFVYLNIKRPANGEDMKSLFDNLSSDHRLRVRIIDLSDHKLKFSRIFPFEFFDNMINTIHDKIYKRILDLVLRKQV